MLKVVAVLAAVAVVAYGQTYEDFIAWTTEHNRVYGDAREHAERFQVWRANHALATHLNRQGRGTFALNRFADLSPEEFAAQYLRPFPVAEARRSGVEELPQGPAWGFPEKKNWVEEGAVNPVRNQGSCGSCYAFSALENAESIYFITKGELPHLSVQQIVDCERDCMLYPGTTQRVCDNGCNGGLMPNVYTYAIRVGMVTEKDYPYKGRVETCKGVKEGKYKFDKWYFVKDNEDAMVQALNEVGPLSVAVDAGNWQHYSGGIFDSSCSSTRMNHAVLLVGYGGDRGQKFWIIQNSWGTGWGEKGFIRLLRGKNKCGVNNFVCTITVQK